MVYVGKLSIRHLLQKPLFIIVQTELSHKWGNDSQRFLLEYFDAIQDSPSKIYHYALPFSPSSSWIRKYYSAELSQVVKVVKGLLVDWGKCSRTVMLDDEPRSLAYWKDTIAVGTLSWSIIIYNGITGCQNNILSGHTDWVHCVTFLSSGVLLLSGSSDKTVKLWDVQTGGVVKTFYGHISFIYSVSASIDCTTIASGSSDGTIRLWNIQTGECYHIIEQQGLVYYVCFSPIDPQYLISGSAHGIWKWNIDNYQKNLMHEGFYAAFSSDGTQTVSCQESAIVVQQSDSGAIVAKCGVHNVKPNWCCFSPDNRLVAAAADNTIYVWDITGSDPHIVETFVEHTSNITSLTFSSPSSLISSSNDKSIKFWQIGASPMDLAIVGPESMPLTPALVKSVTLQANNNIAISVHVDGIVRAWDISTGLCKSSFQTPANTYNKSDAQLVNGRLILVGWVEKKIYIWNVEKEELIQTVDIPQGDVEDIRVLGDGSKLFCLGYESIQVFSMQTGEIVDRVEIEPVSYGRTLTVDGSKVWVYFPGSRPQGWDFGISGSPPIQLPNPSPLYSNDTKIWNKDQYRIEDAMTGRVIHQLAGRFANPSCSQWDGQYLVASYQSGEILILDFGHISVQ